MPQRRIIQIACNAASITSLAAGFALAGLWLGAGVAAAAALAWLVSRGRIFGGWNSTVLVMTTGLAAVGLLLGAGPTWMIFGATFALGGWDLGLLDRSLTSAMDHSTRRLEIRHLRSLALALVPGALAAIAGTGIHFQVSLGVMIVLALLALFGIDRVWRGLSSGK